MNETSTMSMGLFNSALDYLKRSEISQLRLLGGEPTLHPNFTEMVHTGIERGFTILIFSNGMISDRILAYLAGFKNGQISLLLNTIDPLENFPDGMLKQQRTMEVLGNRLKLGINIFSRQQKLDYLIDYVLKYNLNKEIRIGIAHPLLSKKNVWLHPKFYGEIGFKTYELFEKVEGSGIEIGFDCGFVPCMFPEHIHKRMGKVLSNIGKSCGPIPDLLPDGNFISCYPLFNLKTFEFNSKITSKQVSEIFDHGLKSFSGLGIYPRCSDCELFGNQCLGGCVASKINRLQADQRKNLQGIYPGNKLFVSELKKVSEVFDITKRIPPKPFKPENEKLILNESEILHQVTKKEISPGISIYIHIPFCNSKCTFCDLYSYQLKDSNTYLVEEYVKALLKEIAYWGTLTKGRNSHVTTVHFGGGSPMFLKQKFLTRILVVLRSHFRIDNQTEIAVELTADEITGENIKFFNDESISRIHIGIQTLNDSIRRMIGRRDSIHGIREKINKLININAIISADILFGMPDQSEKGLVFDLNELIKYGVDGFALYEFHPSKFLKKQKIETNFFLPNKYENFQMFETGKYILNSGGFRNVFFNHFGNLRDENLYFTYLDRNEDCVALGAISDGVINRVNFRHTRLKKYLQDSHLNKKGLDFGYIESEERAKKKRFETSLMSTKISNASISGMRDYFGNSFTNAFISWKDAGLIRQNHDQFELTASGCFLISNMIEQTRLLTKGEDSTEN